MLLELCLLTATLNLPSVRCKTAETFVCRAMDDSELKHIEALCESLYNPQSTPQERGAAQNELVVLNSSTQYIPHCQYILDHSESAYALLIAGNSLSALVTEFWNSFNADQRLEIRET